MKSYVYHKECSVYPGMYIPSLREEELKPGIRSMKKTGKIPHSFKLRELSDAYVAEMNLPGVNREDFFVRAYANIITIYARQRITEENKGGINQTGRTKLKLVHRQVILPEDADTGFISAEYFSGILRFTVPKSVHPVNPRHSKIIVY